MFLARYPAQYPARYPVSERIAECLRAATRLPGVGAHGLAQIQQPVRDLC